MPMIHCPEASTAVTAATAVGVVTVASTDLFFPGAKAWLHNTSNQARARILILKILSATTFEARRYVNDNENSPPNYGRSDLSAWNANSTVNQEQQLAPYNPSFAKANLP